MPLTPNEIDALAQQEARFFAGIASCVTMDCGTFLWNATFPDYAGANRVLAVRDDGRGAYAIAEEVIAFYRAHGLLPVVELDVVSEAQGIGAALRQRGFRSTVGSRLLMRYDINSAPSIPHFYTAERLPNDLNNEAVQAWLDIAVSMETEPPERDEWRRILSDDVRDPNHQLYLEFGDFFPAACCQLFSNEGYGRIDDVATLPAFQRRGLASSVVAHAVQQSLQQGNHTTFLYCDADSPAEALYRKLGFVTWERNPFRRHILSR
jgi:GNAT superfamily N-acetyltransferase